MAKMLILAMAVTLPAVSQTVDDFLDPSVLHEIRITINPKDWQTLQKDYEDNTYYPANFTWRGILVENVGIRSKGRTTRSAVKPGLRVDINRFEDQEFLGQKSFLLDNNLHDYSMMRERLSMPLFERMGIPAPRETYCRLYVNNAYMGVYGVVEATDKRFLKNWFKEDDGYLYEYVHAEGYGFQYLGDDPNLYSPLPFKAETHEKDPDPKPLVAMIKAFNQSSDADFVNAASEFLDLKKFLTHLAVEAYQGEYDGILSDFGMNNLYFYRFERKNLGQFIPKDKDNTFSGVDYPIFKNVNNNVLVRRCLAVPALKQHFYGELLRAAEIAGGEGGWMLEEIDKVYAQIAPAAREDAHKECPEGTCSLEESNKAFEATYWWMRDVIKGRGMEVVKQLNAAGW